MNAGLSVMTNGKRHKGHSNAVIQSPGEALLIALCAAVSALGLGLGFWLIYAPAWSTFFFGLFFGIYLDSAP